MIPLSKCVEKETRKCIDMLNRLENIYRCILKKARKIIRLNNKSKSKNGGIYNCWSVNRSDWLSTLFEMAQQVEGKENQRLNGPQACKICVTMFGAFGEQKGEKEGKEKDKKKKEKEEEDQKNQNQNERKNKNREKKKKQNVQNRNRNKNEKDSNKCKNSKIKIKKEVSDIIWDAECGVNFSLINLNSKKNEFLMKVIYWRILLSYKYLHPYISSIENKRKNANVQEKEEKEEEGKKKERALDIFSKNSKDLNEMIDVLIDDTSVKEFEDNFNKNKIKKNIKVGEELLQLPYLSISNINDNTSRLLSHIYYLLHPQTYKRCTMKVNINYGIGFASQFRPMMYGLLQLLILMIKINFDLKNYKLCRDDCQYILKYVDSNNSFVCSNLPLILHKIDIIKKQR